jgi:hypothetical protein
MILPFFLFLIVRKIVFFKLILTKFGLFGFEDLAFFETSYGQIWLFWWGPGNPVSDLHFRPNHDEVIK